MNTQPLLLLVEDSRLYQKYLTNLCIKNDYAYISAMTGTEAIELLYTARPDLILLDIHLPGMDGYQICEHIRTTPSINQIPIIFITSNDNEDDIVKGFNLGGNDYVTKPFNQVVLESRIKNQLETVQNRKLLNDYICQLESKNYELKRQKEQSEYLASRDHLTGIYNRRYIQSMIIDSIEGHSDTPLTFSLGLFDIDNFKQVNDRYGHPVGDFVLKEVVEIMQRHIRPEDCLGRWGGEEFLLFLPYTNIEQAGTLVEKMRMDVEAHEFATDDYAFNLTITCGISEFVKSDDYKTIYNRIDEALYDGKHSGKNKIVIK